MRTADRIRLYGREKYALTARDRKQSCFSIRVGEVVRDLKLSGRAPAVCSALKSREFLRENGLRVVHATGPPSGQSTTVAYTYEFIDCDNSGPTHPSSRQDTPQSRQAAWERLRGALKDVFAEYGGGEAYLRAERASFRDADERK